MNGRFATLLEGAGPWLRGCGGSQQDTKMGSRGAWDASSRGRGRLQLALAGMTRRVLLGVQVPYPDGQPLAALCPPEKEPALPI